MFKVKIILQLNMIPKLKSFKFSLMRTILKCLIFIVVQKRGIQLFLKIVISKKHVLFTICNTATQTIAV